MEVLVCSEYSANVSYFCSFESGCPCLLWHLLQSWGHHLERGESTLAAHVGGVHDVQVLL